MDVLGWLIVLLLVLVVAGTAIYSSWRAAPYVPTRQRDVERMLRLAKTNESDLVYDLGAGDGRVLITAVKKFKARSLGYEISLLPWLVGQGRILLNGVGGRAVMKYQDFYRVSLSPASVVICFLTPAAMTKLGDKFKSELHPGTRILSYAFSIPGWQLVLKDKPDAKTMAVYYYIV